MLTRLAPAHRPQIADLLERTPEFTKEEVSVALELVDDALAGGDSYRFWVSVDLDRVHGYVSFGRTPMTQGTWDLYWICVDAAHRGEGVGRALVARMETEIAEQGARLVRVETAGESAYAATRAFYEKIGYAIVATVKDFYWPGNDLVMYGRYL